MTDTAGWPEIESEDDEGVIVEEPLPPPPQPAKAVAATLITNQLFIDFKRRLPEIPIGIQTTPASEQARDMPTSATLKRPQQTFRQPRYPRPGRRGSEALRRHLTMVLPRTECGRGNLSNAPKFTQCRKTPTLSPIADEVRCNNCEARHIELDRGVLVSDASKAALRCQALSPPSSSRDPGHRPFTTVAGIRSPLGRFMLSTACGCLLTQSGAVLDRPPDSRPACGDTLPLELSRLV